ncbi:MAG: hypothetical protein JW395_1891 [Nitrospira sp.]|nr:hypothetical protein [Nitrospira sp.]
MPSAPTVTFVHVVHGPVRLAADSTRALLPAGPSTVNFRTNSNRTPICFVGASTTTVGAVEYPLPAVSIEGNATLSPLQIALAVAPLPPPPLRVTAGSLVYPDPPEVTVMPVTKPAVIVATAVAVSPAKARPIESDINTATVISHPGTFIT